MDIQVRNETFRLTPERCLYWPAHRLLAVAGLNLGRAEAFRRSGLWSPPRAHEDDLERLETCALREGAEEIVFLGDFVHSGASVSREISELFAAWRERFAGRVTVLFENQDRGGERHWPEEWHEINRAAEFGQDGFLFRHEPPEKPGDSFCWAGHVHPVVNLHSGQPDHIRLPCFVVEKHYGLLPAFTSLAEGFAVSPHRGAHVYAVALGFVTEVGPNAARTSA